MAENSTSEIRLRPSLTAATAISSAASRLMRSWCCRWMSDVESTVWRRGATAFFKAAPVVSMLGNLASESAAGGLLAVAQRRVEDLDSSHHLPPGLGIEWGVALSLARPQFVMFSAPT